MQRETVIETVFTELMLAGQLYVNNCTDLREHPTDGSVADTRSQRDGRRLHIRRSFFFTW